MLINLFADFFQEYFFTRVKPLRLRSFIIRSFLITFSIVLVISSIFEGSKYKAASPQTSGKDATFDTTTGQPQAMASNGGIPNPSYNEGKIKHSALEYNSANTLSLTRPVNIIFGFKLY